MQNEAIISLHDPVGHGRRHLENYKPIDFSDKCDTVMYIGIHDLDPESLANFGLTVDAYFSEADANLNRT